MDHPSRRNFLLSGLAVTQARKQPSPELPRRVLGKTGLRVTTLGYGSEAVSDASVLARGIDLGINFYDTAHSYHGGNNERILGQALAGRRKEVVLASRSYEKTAEGLRRELDESLRELRTDYLDIWYIGNKDKAADVTDDMIAVQLAAQKAGKIRFRGFSTHRLPQLMGFILEKKFDVIQITYNFAAVSALEPELDRLKQAGVGAVAMKVLGGAYKGRPGALAAALRWALRNDRIQTSSVGMRDHDQLQENVKAIATPYSPPDDKLLAAQLDRIRPVFCRMCGKCDGVCPQGVPVSDVVRFVMYADSYGDREMARARFADLPAEVRSVRCADCSGCAIRCPNGVRVKQQLERAQMILV